MKRIEPVDSTTYSREVSQRYGTPQQTLCNNMVNDMGFKELTTVYFNIEVKGRKLQNNQKTLVAINENVLELASGIPVAQVELNLSHALFDRAIANPMDDKIVGDWSVNQTVPMVAFMLEKNGKEVFRKSKGNQHRYTKWFTDMLLELGIKADGNKSQEFSTTEEFRLSPSYKKLFMDSGNSLKTEVGRMVNPVKAAKAAAAKAAAAAAPKKAADSKAPRKTTDNRKRVDISCFAGCDAFNGHGLRVYKNKANSFIKFYRCDAHPDYRLTIGEPQPKVTEMQAKQPKQPEISDEVKADQAAMIKQAKQSTLKQLAATTA